MHDEDNESIDSDNEELNVNTNNYSEFIEKKYSGCILEISKIKEIDVLGEITNMLNSTALYDSLHNYSNYVKTVYYILLMCKINNYEFRDDCNCCSKNNLKFDLHSEFIPTHIKINSHINKFMSVIDLLPCYCNFKMITEKQTFYKGDFFNFKDTYKLYLDVIPPLIELLYEYYNLTATHTDIKLTHLSRCIHEDIRYNNVKNCIHKPRPQNDITEYVLQLGKINTYLLKNIKTNLFLFSEQSIQYFKSVIHNPNIFMYFKKIYVKQFSVIDLKHSQNGKTIFDLLINSSIQLLTLKNIFEILFNEYGKKTNIHKHIINLIIECIKNEKYELGIELFTFYKNDGENEEQIKYIVMQIFKQPLTSETKYLFLKNIYDKKIHFINLLHYVLQSEDIIEYLDSSISFEKIYENIQYEQLLNECIKQNKKIFLEYFLNKYKKKIHNAYINYFSNIQKDNIEMLKIITKYNYDINVKINPTTFENGNICLFYYCIKKNFIEAAKILIDSNIYLHNLYNEVSLLILCIQTNNYELGYCLIKKNKELNAYFYENINPVNILLSKMSNSSSYLKLLNELIHIDTNYSDEYNLHVGFGLLKSHLKKHEKIMLFQSIKYKINPLATFKNPLIIECILRNEYEIAYVLNLNMPDEVYKPLITHILGKINVHSVNIFTFENHEYVYIISIFLICYCVYVMGLNKNKMKKRETNYNDNETDHFTEMTNDIFIKHDDDNDTISLTNISFQSWG